MSKRKQQQITVLTSFFLKSQRDLTVKDVQTYFPALYEYQVN